MKSLRISCQLFLYHTTTGKPQFVYSWKLEKTDKTPPGKRDDLSLREKEKLILKDIDDEIVPRGGEMTVEQLVRKYLLQKTGVRHNTEANYNFVLNIIKKEEFGKKRIDKIKLSDAKCWLIKLQMQTLFAAFWILCPPPADRGNAC